MKHTASKTWLIHGQEVTEQQIVSAILRRDSYTTKEDNLHVADDTYPLGYSTESIDLPDVPMVGAFNPFEIDITPNIDNIGMVAFAADSAFCGITDDFVSGSDDFISDNDDITSSDDRFSSNGNSLKIKGDINNDNLHDDLNINNDNSLI